MYHWHGYQSGGSDLNHAQMVLFTCNWHGCQSGGSGIGHTQMVLFYVPPTWVPIRWHWHRLCSIFFFYLPLIQVPTSQVEQALATPKWCFLFATVTDFSHDYDFTQFNWSSHEWYIPQQLKSAVKQADYVTLLSTVTTTSFHLSGLLKHSISLQFSVVDIAFVRLNDFQCVFWFSFCLG